jgi:hypothetical protein
MIVPLVIGSSVSSKNRKQKIPEHATQPEHGLSSLWPSRDSLW